MNTNSEKGPGNNKNPKQSESIDGKQDDYEQYSRRNISRISGFPEQLISDQAVLRFCQDILNAPFLWQISIVATALVLILKYPLLQTRQPPGCERHFTVYQGWTSMYRSYDITADSGCFESLFIELNTKTTGHAKMWLLAYQSSPKSWHYWICWSYELNNWSTKKDKEDLLLNMRF